MAPEIAEKRSKKEKKEKKSKKKSKSEEISVRSEESPSSPLSPEPSKKRKRSTLPEDELEIDINLPEPPSKKALRKAKKTKTAPPTEEVTKPSTDNEEEEAPKEEAKPEKRSQHGIWIGNLPWVFTKENLRAFFVEKGEIADEDITRIHMPAPTEKSNKPAAIKPQNKGFAYVDFAGAESLAKAMALTETLVSGRRVLIKNANSFEGRPEAHTTAEAEKSGQKVITGKPPNKRIFVGNLGFDVTKEDIEEHFKPCGAIAMVHLATFEDSGKCKGYGWVTFEELEAASDAKRGWTMKQEEGLDDEDEEVKSEDGEEDAAKSKKTKKPKMRKWFVNRLQGRQLRCEFAEDAETRYKKRFGKGARAAQDGGPQGSDAQVDGESSAPAFGHDGRKGDKGKKGKKFDPRTIAPGAANMNAPRASAAIVASKGTKTTFD